MHPQFPVAQCVAVYIGSERGAELSVASITIAGVEQLLGDGVPASFFQEVPVQFDRQTSAVPLIVTLQNDGHSPASAEVVVEFMPLEALTLSKARLH